MPARHIRDGGENTSVTTQVPVRTVVCPGAFVWTAVPRALGVVLDGDGTRRPGRYDVAGVEHACGTKKVLVKVLLIASSGDDLDDRGEEAVAQVRVPVPRSRFCRDGSRSRPRLQVVPM